MTTFKKPFTWSYSSMSTYNMCPFKWNKIKNFGMVEPESYFLEKGLEAHSNAENYLLGKLDILPSSLTRFRKEFNNLKKNNAIPEESWAVDKDWNIIADTPEQPAWTHTNVWCRMKLDARIENYIVDFKTGKQYDSHEEQASLYATTFLVNNPEHKDTFVEFWYLRDGKVVTWEYYRKDLQKYLDKWQSKVDVMQADKEYMPKKNDYCKYCHVKNLCPLYA